MKKMLLAMAALMAATPAMAGTFDGYSAKKAKDGYSFGQAEYMKTKVSVEIVYVDSYKDMLAKFDATTGVIKASVVGNEKLRAFSILRPTKDACVIYLIKPDVAYVPEDLGHEMYHCLMGQFHKTQ